MSVSPATPYDNTRKERNNQCVRTSRPKVDNDVLQRVDEYLFGYKGKQKKKPIKQDLQKIENLQKNKKQEISIEDARVRNSFIGREKSFTRDHGTQRYKSTTTKSTEYPSH